MPLKYPKEIPKIKGKYQKKESKLQHPPEGDEDFKQGKQLEEDQLYFNK